MNDLELYFDNVKYYFCKNIKYLKILNNVKIKRNNHFNEFSKTNF